MLRNLLTVSRQRRRWTSLQTTLQQHILPPPPTRILFQPNNSHRPFSTTNNQFSLDNPLVNPILDASTNSFAIPLDQLQLDALAEETNQLLQARQGEKALPLLKQWVVSHAAWHEEFMTKHHDDSVDTAGDTTAADNSLTLKALLMGCNAVHNLLPCIEPRLAPYNYMEPLFETHDGFDGTVTAPRPLSPAQLWAVTLQAISVSAETMQAYHAYHTRYPVNDRSLLKLSRGIPQRTEALWERLQSADRDPESPELLQRAQNQVLSTWADSLEHARGFHAEAFFQQMQKQAQQQQQQEQQHQHLKRQDEPIPDPQALRIILRAWCQSHEKGAAYHAQKHLQTMQGILRAQKDEVAQQEFNARKKALMDEARRSRRFGEYNSNDASDSDGDNQARWMDVTDKGTVSEGEVENHLEVDSSDTHLELYPFEPSLEEYQMVLRAWSKDPSNRAVSRAMSIMKDLEELVDSKATIVRPDVKCFRYILTTAARRPLMDPSRTAPLLKDAWRAMDERWLVHPDFQCYAATIRAWRNIAVHPSNESSNALRDVGFKHARDLLEDSKMVQQRRYLYKGEKGLTTKTYNDVLDAASVWSADFEDKIDFGDRLLRELETDENTPKPNSRSYVNMVNLLKSTLSVNGSHRKPLAEAKKVLWRMVDQLEPAVLDRQGNLQKRDGRTIQRKQQSMEEQEILSMINGEGYPVDALNAFIEMCASSANYLRKDGKEGMIVLRDAIAAVDSFRRRKIQPNWTTYATLLMAIEKLLPTGEQRSKVAQHVFTLACSDGMVEDETLKALADVVPEERYRELVLSKSSQVEGTLVVPDEWTRIALGGKRVLSNDGSRSRPLSASGQLITTRAMKEFQMRSLRDKRNQKLLRGGRWTEADSLSHSQSEP